MPHLRGPSARRTTGGRRRRMESHGRHAALRRDGSRRGRIDEVGARLGKGRRLLPPPRHHQALGSEAPRERAPHRVRALCRRRGPGMRSRALRIPPSDGRRHRECVHRHAEAQPARMACADERPPRGRRIRLPRRRPRCRWCSVLTVFRCGQTARRRRRAGPVPRGAPHHRRRKADRRHARERPHTRERAVHRLSRHRTGHPRTPRLPPGVEGTQRQRVRSSAAAPAVRARRPAARALQALVVADDVVPHTSHRWSHPRGPHGRARMAGRASVGREGARSGADDRGWLTQTWRTGPRSHPGPAGLERIGRQRPRRRGRGAWARRSRGSLSEADDTHGRAAPGILRRVGVRRWEDRPVPPGRQRLPAAGRGRGGRVDPPGRQDSVPLAAPIGGAEPGDRTLR